MGWKKLYRFVSDVVLYIKARKFTEDLLAPGTTAHLGYL